MIKIKPAIWLSLLLLLPILRPTKPVVSAPSRPPSFQLISDHAAYEALLRSLVEGPAVTDEVRKQEQARVAAFAKQIGLEEKATTALLSTAREFHARVARLDAAAKKIKDQSWPHPDLKVMEDLKGLQDRKMNLIDETISSLFEHFSADEVNKFGTYVSATVKPSMEITPLTSILAVRKGVNGVGLAYNYAVTAFDMQRPELYGWCSATEDYDSPGHRYSATVTNSSENDEPRSSASMESVTAPLNVVTVTPLCQGGVCYDGLFKTSCDVKEESGKKK